MNIASMPSDCIGTVSVYLPIPTAQCCAGQMKDILTTGLGLFLFGDVMFSAKNIIGVVTGLAGGILYSTVSFLERRPKPDLAKR